MAILPIIPKTLNTTKIVPLKASDAKREEMLVRMLDETYDFISRNADTTEKAQKTIPLAKFKAIFKKAIPDINFKTNGLNIKELADNAFLESGYNSKTFKKTDYALYFKVDRKNNIKLDANYFGLLMHELTHLYEQITKPKLSLTYTKLKSVHGTPEKTINAVEKWNKIFTEKIYTPFAANLTDEKTFRNTINEELKNNKVISNYERIQYLKEFYLTLKMEKRAYASSSKYSLLREKEYRADYNNLLSTKHKKSGIRESNFTQIFEKTHQFDLKLKVLKEELITTIKKERERLKRNIVDKEQ